MISTPPSHINNDQSLSLFCFWDVKYAKNLIVFAGLSLTTLTHSTCYSWVCLISPLCYGWKCLLLTINNFFFWLVKNMSINPKSVQFHQCKKVKLIAKWWHWKWLAASILSWDKENGGQTLEEDWNSLSKFQYNYLDMTKQSTKLNKKYLTSKREVNIHRSREDKNINLSLSKLKKKNNKPEPITKALKKYQL